MRTSSSRSGLWLSALLLLQAGPALRAGEPDTSYAWILYAGGGYTRNVSEFDYTPSGLIQNGFSGTARLMWKPEHLMRVGIETGYHYVYGANVSDFTNEFGTTNARSSMHVLPILLVFSMPLVEGVDIWTGLGAGLLTSYVEFFGESTAANAYSPYVYGALSYMVPIASDWRLGAEARYVYMERFRDQNLTVQFMASWQFSTY
jgi:hypothetical protein